ncbi:hypothetical protein BCR37DRAFT_47640 [Protomyces lactucae-debilis]|uniref:Uncharacterized protein n=1 Tax=Protomyces lactucae-debilis TaxID=2754530 RepID=A0A1Y2FCB7_PROLT|nr:uncharacterized protein BCR37DRAFT_47640 [Protomyces lactucae-debilis]ORY81563.1 hypothetical protein BCR37DRAFT_47640 [Protomyces lactucae-debilis]
MKGQPTQISILLCSKESLPLYDTVTTAPESKLASFCCDTKALLFLIFASVKLAVVMCWQIGDAMPAYGPSMPHIVANDNETDSPLRIAAGQWPMRA